MWKASTHMLLSKEPKNIELMVVGLGHCHIIRGMPWLKTWNPRIDWKSHTLSFPTSSPTDYDEHILPQRYLLHWLGLNVDWELTSLYDQQYSSEVDVSPREYLPQEDPLDEKSIQKITLSTKLAQDAKTSEISFPEWCKDFEDVFSEKTYDTLPPHHPYDHTIDLKPSFIPKITKAHPPNPKEKEACQAFVEEHLKTGHILPSKSSQAAPFFFVPKKKGSLHPCQDYQYLNSHTVWNAYPLPLIPELIDNMKDSTLFTKFDIHWGYNNIQIQETDQWKAAFITPFGLFESTVIFFGFCNALPTFQAFMNHIFADMIAEHWLKIYMGDLSIHTQGDLTLHHECTRHVLLHLREHGLSLKLSKCLFDAPKMEFLGMIIGQGQIAMDPVKLTAIHDWKPPASVKGIRSFLGFTNFYSKFIPNFSHVVTPLNLLTQKDQPWNWTPLQQKAFNTLRNAFSSGPVLGIPDVTRIENYIRQ